MAPKENLKILQILLEILVIYFFHIGTPKIFIFFSLFSLLGTVAPKESFVVPPQLTMHM